MSKKSRRRGKYYTHVEQRLIEVEGWERDGLIDEQIAQNIGISRSTLCCMEKQVFGHIGRLKNRQSVFSAVLKGCLQCHKLK